MPMSPGSRLAGYRVVSQLGADGSGEIYLVDNEQLGRREILRLLSGARAADPDFQRRFSDAARAAASLDHPGISRIHNYGVTDGSPWYTTSHRDGQDLASARLTPAELGAVLIQVGDALDYAHRQGVPSCAITPASIVVTRDRAGAVGRAVLFDVGVALDGGASATAFTAPEVAAGQPAGPAADQYALARIVSPLLYGPALAAAGPALQRATAANPADRYRDCSSFAADLSRALAAGASGPAAPTAFVPNGPRPGASGPQPPTYGTPQPPAYGTPQPPAYGTPQPPAYGTQPGYGTPPPGTLYPPHSQPTMSHPGVPQQGMPYPGTGPQAFAGMAGGPPPGQASGAWAQPAAAPRRRGKGKLVALSLTAVVLLVLSIGGIGYLMGWFSEDKKAPEFLASSVTGANAFGQDFTNTSVDMTAEKVETLRHASGGSSSGVVDASGDKSLYGGSSSATSCDTDALTTYLIDTAGDKGRTFAEASGVQFDDLSQYLINLTPVYLARDTWVTNNGYQDGKAEPFQAVLSAGSAVLVDEHGLPRVRCNSGNPLGEPKTGGYDPGASDEKPWEGYSSGDVVRIAPTEAPLTEMSYVDIDTGETRTRGLGGGKPGAIQVTLSWDGRADIDIHAEEPSGTEIYYGNTTSSYGGELDIDACVSEDSPTCRDTDNLENIAWSVSNAPRGTYRAWVYAYGMHGLSSVPYTARVFVDGRLADETSGTFTSSGQRSTTLTFSY